MSDQELKDKILQSAEKIPVPESLEPEKMEEKLSSVVQAEQKKSRFSRKLLSVAAALAVLIVSGAAVAKVTGVFTEQQTYIETPEKLGKRTAAPRDSSRPMVTRNITGISRSCSTSTTTLIRVMLWA